MGANGFADWKATYGLLRICHWQKKGFKFFNSILSTYFLGSRITKFNRKTSQTFQETWLNPTSLNARFHRIKSNIHVRSRICHHEAKFLKKKMFIKISFFLLARIQQAFFSHVHHQQTRWRRKKKMQKNNTQKNAVELNQHDWKFTQQ